MKPTTLLVIVLVLFAVGTAGGALWGMGDGDREPRETRANQDTLKDWGAALSDWIPVAGITASQLQTTCNLAHFAGTCVICVEHPGWLPARSEMTVKQGRVSFELEATKRAAAFGKLGQRCMAPREGGEFVLANSPNCDEDPCKVLEQGKDASLIVESPGGLVPLVCKSGGGCRIDLSLAEE